MGKATDKPHGKRRYYDNLNTEQRRIFKIDVAWFMAVVAAGLLSYVALAVYLGPGPWRGLFVPLLWIGVTGIGVRVGMAVINRRLDRMLSNPGGAHGGSP
jgi:hypothetical protein